MRIVLAIVLLVAAAILCGCASDQVPSWAIAAAQSQNRPGQTVAKHDGWKTSARIKITHPAPTSRQAGDTTTSANKIETKLVASDGSIPKQDYTGNVPSKYKGLAVRLQQWDRRQDEENRRINTAIAICRC